MLVLVLGVGLILYGLLIMSLRPAAIESVAVFAGVSFVVVGAAQFLHARDLADGWRVLANVGDTLGLAAGIGSPERRVLLFVNLVGLWVVVVGVDCIVAAFGTRRGS